MSPAHILRLRRLPEGVVLLHRDYPALCITDGNWHRIGFVWDGSYRHLHVDGVEVAGDDAPLSDLAGAGGGLYLGVASTFAPGTFFSGLVDDVRSHTLDRQK